MRAPRCSLQNPKDLLPTPWYQTPEGNPRGPVSYALIGIVQRHLTSTRSDWNLGKWTPSSQFKADFVAAGCCLSRSVVSSGILMTVRTEVFPRRTFDCDKMITIMIGIYENTEGHHKVWVIPPLFSFSHFNFTLGRRISRGVVYQPNVN